MRALWNGRLQFSLFDIPVKIYAATQSNDVTFHTLHAPCQTRIKMEKRCPTHGPVLEEELVKGYEYEKDKFVTVTEEDLKKANPDADHSLSVLQFVEKEALDPLLFDTPYYMVPDGPLAADVYATLRESIRNSNKYGIGKIVMRRREILAALWVKENAIVVSTLRYDDEIRNLASIGELNGVKKNKEDIKMAEELIERHTKKLRLKSFKDTYQQRLVAMLKKKVAQIQKEEQQLAEITKPMVEEEKMLDEMAVTETGVASVSEASEAPPVKRKMAKAPPVSKTEKKRKVA
jgi:DNA end-binding protein Ku